MLQYRAFSLAFFCLAIAVSWWFCLAFHRAPFYCECFLSGLFHTLFYPSPRSSCDFGLFSVWLHLWIGGKQAQDPPWSLHTILSPVEWSSLKGRSPQWFTVRKTTGFTKMPLVTISSHVISLMLLLSLLCPFWHCIIVSFLTYSSFYGFFLGFSNFYQVLFLWPFMPSSSWWLVFSTP